MWEAEGNLFPLCLMNGVLDGAAITGLIVSHSNTAGDDRAPRPGAVERASPDIRRLLVQGVGTPGFQTQRIFKGKVRKPQAIFGNGPAPVRTRTPPRWPLLTASSKENGRLAVQSFHFLVLRKLLLRSHLVYLLCGAKFLNGRFSPSRVSSAAPAKRRTTQTKTNRLVPPSLS